MADREQNEGGDAPPAPAEHLNIKVTDNNNEVFFKIKRSTKLEKLMKAFCERQGKDLNTVRFLYDGDRVTQNDSPDTVCASHWHSARSNMLQLGMDDGDTLEVHQEQIGGGW